MTSKLTVAATALAVVAVFVLQASAAIKKVKQESVASFAAECLQQDAAQSAVQQEINIDAGNIASAVPSTYVCINPHSLDRSPTISIEAVQTLDAIQQAAASTIVESRLLDSSLASTASQHQSSAGIDFGLASYANVHMQPVASIATAQYNVLSQHAVHSASFDPACFSEYYASSAIDFSMASTVNAPQLMLDDMVYAQPMALHSSNLSDMSIGHYTELQQLRPVDASLARYANSISICSSWSSSHAIESKEVDVALDWAFMSAGKDWMSMYWHYAARARFYESIGKPSIKEYQAMERLIENAEAVEKAIGEHSTMSK